MAGGALLPAIGLGTFGSDAVPAEAVAEAVVGAVSAGYRHVDCASVYGNERAIGDSLRRVLESGVRRDELWITSKLWNDKHAERDVILSCEQSVRDLQLDYLDLYLVHWPFPNYHPPGCDVTARSADASPYIHERYMATWRSMEKLVAMGLVRHIGTSNMTVPKLELLLRDAAIRPAVNQMELHPHFQQEEFFRWVQHHGIVPVGYSPLGSPGRPERDRTPDDTVDLEDAVIVAIAASPRRPSVRRVPEVGPPARRRRDSVLGEPRALPVEPARRGHASAQRRGHDRDCGDRSRVPSHQGPGVPLARGAVVGRPLGSRRPHPAVTR